MEGQPNPEQPRTNHWYSVAASTTHSGARSEATHTNYVYAKDAVDAVNKAKKMRGINISREGINATPLDTDAEQLLMGIMKELNVPAALAKRRGLYGMRDDFDIDTILQERLTALRRAQNKT